MTVSRALQGWPGQVRIVCSAARSPILYTRVRAESKITKCLTFHTEFLSGEAEREVKRLHFTKLECKVGIRNLTVSYRILQAGVRPRSLQNRSLFSCAEGKAVFVPHSYLAPDPRFAESLPPPALGQDFGPQDSPAIPGFRAPHPTLDTVQSVAGRNKGIQVSYIRRS